ncbi:DUF475 domain-containing protein [Anaplasmataceae bacterium AB001_6]|nr:DUF475 domain-containing protein [Anaplasmataceae bacterium AB001_6]
MDFSTEALYTFFIILFLELVLGADNIVFISFVVEKVKRPRLIAFIGLSFALIIRGLMLLFLDFFIKQSDNNVIYTLSVFDIIMLLGGGFLLYKAIIEIINFHFKKENNKIKVNKKSYKNSYYAFLEIIWIDFILSFDSIITAIAFTRNFEIIILAFAITMLFMVTIYSILLRFLSRYAFIRIIVFIFIGILGMKLILESLGIIMPRILFYLFLLCITILYFIMIYLRKKLKNK